MDGPFCTNIWVLDLGQISLWKNMEGLEETMQREEEVYTKRAKHNFLGQMSHFSIPTHRLFSPPSVLPRLIHIVHVTLTE